MEKAQSQMKKVLMFYREEVVKELAGKYGFVEAEALAYLKSKEEKVEEKRGRPVKKAKTLVTKEQEVDAVVMEMLADPLEAVAVAEASEVKEAVTEKKVRAPKKKKADAPVESEASSSSDAEETAKSEKKVRVPKKKKADAPAEANEVAAKPAPAPEPVKEAPKETAVENKTHVGGFPLKTQTQEKKKPAALFVTKEATKEEVIKEAAAKEAAAKEAAAKEAAAAAATKEDDDEGEDYEEFEFEGKTYLRTTDNVVFDKETERGVGHWNEEEKQIDFEEESEDEEEEEE